jgi:toxin ParE1/3/4
MKRSRLLKLELIIKMVYKLIITPEANDEMQQAFNYYTDIQCKLGDRFLNNLETAFSKIKSNPTHFGFINDEKIIRDYLLSKFPYQVVYKIVNDVVYILSVFQAQQDPNKKLR